MPRLVEVAKLKSNPFEHYVAENEPGIAEYAVKPPYFEIVDESATRLSSYILFGDRGAGKSATRLTLFKQLWPKKSLGDRVPLAVNQTDFSSVAGRRKFEGLSEKALLKDVAFIVIEGILTWLSSMEDGDRQVFLEAMTDDESHLCYMLLRDYYASRPGSKREKSIREAMELLNQALLKKSKLWLERRWDPIARLVGSISESIMKKYASIGDGTSKPIADVLSGQTGDDFDSVLLLRRLVQFVNIFDFSGIVVLVDKVDETDVTMNSASNTAILIHPILSHIQLMEVQGFSWIFFLWSSVKEFFDSGQYSVRFDKIRHATISWDNRYFTEMLNKRVRYFSEGRIDFSGLFVDGTDVEKETIDLISLSMRSPRDLIRLIDIIVREHDISNTDNPAPTLLGQKSIQAGSDKYVTDVVNSVYGERLLAQIFRINKIKFTNKDVQMTFRVGAQSARTRIQSWQSAGIIKLTGTVAAEGAAGGKPANEYTVIDARIERAMKRQLIIYDPLLPSGDSDFNAEEEE